MKIELLQPVYIPEENAVQSFKAFTDAEFKGLEVSCSVTVQNKRFHVSLDGEDAEVCENLLYKEFGKPVTKKEIAFESDSDSETAYKGFIQTINPDQILVNIGFELPITTESLEQLGAGTAGQIAARFGMIPYLPVTVHVLPDGTAAFTKEQIDQWWSWKKTSTDRIFVNGATRSQVKAALQRKGHGRDVYGVEKIGLTECVIICKEKTDGPGIVSSIGRVLPVQMGVLLGMKK
ncbi:DUF2110 family protein [Methanimicrococcus blatticola]|uniref:DUF2110 family protein n=1 Tax=Methanimicrococcus blatticola TaxID=91560 RepID=A0A484F5D5_9EURY|nr:DUF2110 family protein [Methanimicrococcus blatticola]MBZ3934897.1 DUF2110 family protein [Methanimicrococcus blatticola]MCC2509004.1 DUF2110 family protein [Methanimicrococcus blatticola]TDQ70969.1 hypothetical protein C7391_0065 [Methanimicrococcus blatticola]